MLPPATRHQHPATDRRPAATPSLRFALGRRGDLRLSTSATADSGSDFRFQVSVLRPPRKAFGFTLIEILVVMAIIIILAGLGFSGISTALKTAKKSEVRTMANQIKLGLHNYYTEYGTYPNVTNTDAAFLAAMKGATNQPTIPNRRGLRFLEVPAKFTNSSGIVTPQGFYGADGRSNFVLIIDTNYDGKIRLPGQSTDSDGSLAVYVTDPDIATKYLSTW